MSLKSMRAGLIRVYFPLVFWVVVVGLFVATIGALTLVREHGRFTYEPVQVEGLTPVPRSPREGVNVGERREVRQSFRSGDTAFKMTEVGIGIMNWRGAPATAVVTVRLQNQENRVLAQAQVAVEDLRQDDMTILPMSVELEADHTYTLIMTTHGVPTGSDLTMWYEVDPAAQVGEVTVWENGKVRRRLDGNIRFAILRQLTYGRLLVDQLALRWWLVGIVLVVVILSWFGRQHLVARWTRSRQREPQSVVWSLFHHKRESVFVIVAGLMLALTVTLPYYTQLDRISTMGDVQRALVYRALGRTALLERGEVALWDPYLCGGEPLLGNMESAQSDPFFLLVLAFGENLGVRLSVTATLALGFVGMYALARRFGQMPRLPALLAAAIFPFSGFQMLAFANGNFAWIPVGWIPWVLYWYVGSLTRRVQIIPAALALAFVFWGGSLHMTIYALLAVGLLGGWLALLRRELMPIVMMTALVVLWVPLVAIKLLPVAEIQAVSGEFYRPPPFIQPWEWLDDMFVSRQQLNREPWRFVETGEYFRWIEYGAYVGLVPVLLAAAGIVARGRGRRRYWAVVGAALVTLLMTFGAFPWPVLKELPMLYGVLRNPQRARVIFLLFLGLLAGYGLWEVGRQWVSRQRLRHLVWAVVVALVWVDLVTFHAALYPHLWRFERPELVPVTQFERITESFSDFEARDLYKVSYENFRAGQGTTDMCMPYMMGRGVHARGKDSSNPARPYFGEATLTRSGQIENVQVDGDRVVVSLTTNEEQWLLVNQNFFPGWRSEPPREVRQREGLVAVRVQPGDQQITLRYQPRSYEMGLMVTLLAGLVSLGWLGLERRSA